MRASDGTVLGTFPVDDGPEGVFLDGANIWVANDFSDTVTKLRASDGGVLGTFFGGDGPVNFAFDGKDMWVTDYYSYTVTVRCGPTTAACAIV